MYIITVQDRALNRDAQAPASSTWQLKTSSTQYTGAFVEIFRPKLLGGEADPDYGMTEV